MIPGGPGEQLLVWQVMTDVCGSGCSVCTVGEDCMGSVCTRGGEPSTVGGVDLDAPDMTACAVVGGGGDALQLSVECQL